MTRSMDEIMNAAVENAKTQARAAAEKNMRKREYNKKVEKRRGKK